MSKTDINLRDDEVAAVMPHFRVGPVLFTRPCGGTANAGLIVTTPAGQYFLRRRNPRYSDPQQLAYDHHVLTALYRRGLPVPKTMLTKSGSRWVEHDGCIYELYGFIEGACVVNPDPAQIADAGAVLARFHAAGVDLRPPGKKPFGRFWGPQVAVTMLERLLERTGAGDVGSLRAMSADEALQVLEYLMAQARSVEDHVPDAVYWALPQTIIHGDWHPANLKFGGARVTGIFDFDWVDRQPRMVDIADGLLYLCGIRRVTDERADIWTLTETPKLDWPRMRTFLHSYAGVHPPTDAELAALPYLMSVRWIYSRVDAADRKIPEPDQLRFVLRDVTSPLLWVAENRNELSKDGWWL